MMLKKKLTVLLLVVLSAVTLFGTVASAAESYQTYTFSPDGFMLESPAAYTPAKTVTSASIGLDVPFDNATDLFVDEDGYVYLADVKNNRIVVMEGENFKLQFTLDKFEDNTGVSHSLSEPQGVFVRTDDAGKHIYVCDTKNSRLVVFDGEGNFERIIGKPTSALFGTDTLYNPIAVAVDQYGRIFVVSSSTYEGVIVLTPEGDFTSYIGAQKVSYNIFQIIWRRFQTKEQRESQERLVSTEFNNITIDEDGFIYVTTNTIKDNDQQSAITSKSADYAPVKKLNSAGDEIMKRNGFFAPGGEVTIQNFTTDDNTVPTGPSRIMDVAIGEEGTWSIVDSKRSKIFTYDSNGSLLFAFGDKGTQMGNMQNISAIVYRNSFLLVLDSEADTFTVFKRTDYGNLLIQALHEENSRDYDSAVNTWLEVLKYNNNFDAAYIGVGQAHARQGRYEEAMQYFEAAYDTENWSKAYKEVRKDWIEKFFILIPIIAIAVCLGFYFFLKFAGKFNHKVAHNGRVRKRYVEELMYCFHLMFHPFDGFWDLKHERRGSLRAALTILAVVICCFYYQSVGTGYIMNPKGTYSTIITQLLAVGLPLLLWVVANWCLTTLFEGEGSLKDIAIATCYSLSPMAIILIGTTIASNFVSLEESSIVSLVIVFGYIWVGLLLYTGMMVTHGYSFGKNFIITIFTVVGMAVIMFVGFLFSSLVGKMVSFVSSIIVEIGYRI